MVSDTNEEAGHFDSIYVSLTAPAADIATLESDLSTSEPVVRSADDTRTVVTCQQPKFSDVEPIDNEEIKVTEVPSETTILITAAKDGRRAWTRATTLEVPETGVTRVSSVSLVSEPVVEVKTGQADEDVTIVEDTEAQPVAAESQQTEREIEKDCDPRISPSTSHAKTPNLTRTAKYIP